MDHVFQPEANYMRSVQISQSFVYDDRIIGLRPETFITVVTFTSITVIVLIIILCCWCCHCCCWARRSQQAVYCPPTSNSIVVNVPGTVMQPANQGYAPVQSGFAHPPDHEHVNKLYALQSQERVQQDACSSNGTGLSWDRQSKRSSNV